MAMAKKQLYSQDELNKMTKKAKFHYENVIIPEKENEVKEGTEKFQNIIKGRDAFLGLFEENKLEFSIRYKGKVIPIELKPISPGDDLSILNHKPEDIYPDLSPEELHLVQKQINGQYLSENEKQKLKKLNPDPDGEGVSKSIMNNMHNALAQQVIEPSLTIEDWESINDFGIKATIYDELQTRLGINPTTQIDIF